MRGPEEYNLRTHLYGRSKLLFEVSGRCLANYVAIYYERERERVMQKRSINFAKEKASNVSLVSINIEDGSKTWKRERERERERERDMGFKSLLWRTFCLSPTNLCWVGRSQDNTLWVCHVCIMASLQYLSLSHWISYAIDIVILKYNTELCTSRSKY